VVGVLELLRLASDFLATVDVGQAVGVANSGGGPVADIIGTHGSHPLERTLTITSGPDLACGFFFNFNLLMLVQHIRIATSDAVHDSVWMCELISLESNTLLLLDHIVCRDGGIAQAVCGRGQLEWHAGDNGT
jgi:hypothetical protein